jgi:hypothetical protein
MAEEKKAADEAPKNTESTDASAGVKSTKVSHMTLAEVEKAIDLTQKQMGGLTSRYGRALVAQREVLKSSGAK